LLLKVEFGTMTNYDASKARTEVESVAADGRIGVPICKSALDAHAATTTVALSVEAGVPI